MTREPDTEALDRVARDAIDRGVDLDAFVEAAWTAYVDARPGLREKLERARLVEQLEVLRSRGLIGNA